MMSSTDDELDRLSRTLAEVLGGLGDGFNIVAAHIFALRALVGLLDERGILSTGDVRERALDLIALHGTMPPDVERAVERMLSDTVPAPAAGRSTTPH